MLAVLLLAGGLILSDPVVIDGDTLRDGQERYRIENLDAPEVGGRARCEAEAVLGAAARDEVRRMVAQAQVVEAFPVGRRDRYGRVVARIEVDGVDIGEHLQELELGRPWRGRSSNFCE